MNAKSSGQAALSLEVGSDGVAWLIFDQPDARVNVLSSTVLARLDAVLGEIENAARAGRVHAVVVRSGKDGTFIAGADINEIADVPSGEAAERGAREGQRIFRRLDLLPVPSVAAVDGICLGGGTELILACDARIASDRAETKIGLPEVRLGIIPGFGGTTRLPRVVGLREALGLILTGTTVSARKAQRIGLISERMHPAVLYERAQALALELAQGKRPRRPKRPLLARVMDETRIGRAVVLRQARLQVLRDSGGHYPAPLVALDVIRRSARLPLDAALEIEAAAVGQLVGSDVSRNLIHVFHLMEGAKKAGPRAVAPRAVEHVAVVGAGVMGGGIAQLLAYRDLDVRLKDIDAAALGLGLKHARELFDRLAQRGRLEKRDVERYMDAIAPTLDYSGFGTADLVIEAVVERMDVKKAVLREVETEARADCVLTTNTSSLSVSEMQTELERPANFAGMHFFNPVHRMPLVEVVRGERTSDETVATVVALTRRLDKTPVIVRDGPGFLVNRVLAPYLNEAGWLLAEGGAIDRIDAALREFGMPMGPLRLLDEIGLDVARHAGSVLAEAFGERFAPPPPIIALAESGLTGKKGGRGFYRYAGSSEEGVNDGIYRTLGDTIAQRRAIGADAMRERCLLAMVNEAARVLEDRIVDGPDDVDLGMITGTGFPPFRGGLLRWADSLGTRHVLVRLLALESAHGARFAPAPLIRERAAAGAAFYHAPPVA